MADHALAGGNSTRERVLDGMTRFIFRDGRIRRSAVTRVAELRVRARVNGIAVVGINHMASRATAGAVVSGMIIGAGQGKDGIEQARFLQAEKNRIGAQFRAEAAIAEFVVGLARMLLACGIADFGLLAAASFEHAQKVARLRSFPAIKRREFGKNPLKARLFRCGWRNRLDRLSDACAVVTLAEARIFVRKASVVVERRAP